MSRTLSSTATSAVFSQQTEEVFVTLLEISHADLSETLYVSSDPTTDFGGNVYGTTSNGQNYIFFPFEFRMQEQSDNLISKASLRIDNVTRDIILAIRSVQSEEPQVDIKVVLASAPDDIEFEIPSLKLNNITANAFIVAGELRPVVVQNEQYPYLNFNYSDFAGIYQ